MKKFVTAVSLAVFAAAVQLHGAAAATSAPRCTKMTKRFIGTLCTPADGKRHPAMILLGGSEGGDSMARVANVFAKRGYVTASVAYFGLPGLPKYLVNVPVETVGRAIAALQARNDVIASKIGIMGASKGGEFTLLAASTYPQLHAVIAVVPSPVAFMGLGQYNMPTDCSWSKGGKSLPCVGASPDGSAAIGKAFSSGQPVALKPLYDDSLNANDEVTKAAYFPLQNIAAPVLCLAAADDQMWNSPRQCTMALDYLKSRQHVYADRAITYPNAGHLFIFAQWIPAAKLLVEPVPGTPGLAFGGTVDGDRVAAKAAWKTIWHYLATTLGTKN
ncbi:MAG: alpha/beta hydrolase family protein [Vulcanimicrobiaceae bacterium]